MENQGGTATLLSSPPLIWSKSEMDEIFNSHAGFVPRVRLVRPFASQQTTLNSASSRDEIVGCGSDYGTCHHNFVVEPSSLKRKREKADDDDANEYENDETDSHCVYLQQQKKRLNNNKIVKLNNCFDGVNAGDELMRLKSSASPTLSSSLLREANERDLWLIVSMCKKPHKWKTIAKGFGLLKRDIDEIKHRHWKRTRRHDECLYQSMLKWRQKREQSLSVETVLSELNIADEEFRSRLNDDKTQQEQSAQQRPSELALWRLSELVWAEWKPLGRVLGLGEHHLAYVEHTYGGNNHDEESDGERECAYQCLLLAVATVDDVLRALRLLELNFYARRFLDIVASSC